MGVTANFNFSLVRGGRIAGTVVSTATGLPLSGINVARGRYSGQAAAGGTTDATGAFITTNNGLVSGNYIVRTSNGQLYVNKVHKTPTDVPCLGLCAETTLGTPVAVTLGATTTGVDFDLDPGGQIAGTVTGPGAFRWRGVTVEVFGDPNANPVALATTAPDGTFLTGTGAQIINLKAPTGAGLPSGTYTARTQNALGLINERFSGRSCADGCSIALQGGDPIVVTAPSVTTGATFALDVDGDTDGDGIRSSVDANRGAASADFSDLLQGGTTSGSIVATGGWMLDVADVSPGGVQAAVAGSGSGPTILQTCAVGNPEEVRLNADGSAATIECDAGTGSTTVRALVASLAAPVELRKTVNGLTTVIQMVAGQTATVGSPDRR